MGRHVHCGRKCFKSFSFGQNPWPKSRKYPKWKKTKQLQLMVKVWNVIAQWALLLIGLCDPGNVFPADFRKAVCKSFDETSQNVNKVHHYSLFWEFLKHEWFNADVAFDANIHAGHDWVLKLLLVPYLRIVSCFQTPGWILITHLEYSCIFMHTSIEVSIKSVYINTLTVVRVVVHTTRKQRRKTRNFSAHFCFLWTLNLHMKRPEWKLGIWKPIAVMQISFYTGLRWKSGVLVKVKCYEVWWKQTLWINHVTYAARDLNIHWKDKNLLLIFM